MKIRVQKKLAKKHIKYAFSRYDFLIKRFNKSLYNNFEHDLKLLLFDISNKDIEFFKLQKEYGIKNLIDTIFENYIDIYFNKDLCKLANVTNM